MICRLCLISSANIINIFESNIGVNVAEVLQKHFWFKIATDDPISVFVCKPCWEKVCDFNEFYKYVEEVQLEYTKNGNFPDKCNNETESVEVCEMKVEPVFEEAQCDSPKEFLSNDGNNAEEGKNATLEDQRGHDVLDLLSCWKEENDRIQIKEEDVDKDHETHSTEEATASYLKAKVRSRNQKSNRRVQSAEAEALIAKHVPLICDLCGSGQNTFAEIIQHFQEVHNQRGYIVCCGRKLYKRILLVEHINKHIDPEYFKCHDCNKVYADRSTLRWHELSYHTSDDKLSFKCDNCPKKFAKQYLLEKHRLFHKPFEERVVCEICDRRFFSMAFLRAHTKKKHSSEMDIICHICAKVIQGKSAFERHQIEHSSVKPPKVQCEKCGSWLKNKLSLKSHMRLHKEKEKQHICGICGKISPNKIALRTHIRYSHLTKRDFKCKLCDKSFKKQLALKEHMTTHTGGRLYSCPHCPKTFNSNGNMYKHRKNMHPKEWEEHRAREKEKPPILSTKLLQFE